MEASDGADTPTVGAGETVTVSKDDEANAKAKKSGGCGC